YGSPGSYRVTLVVVDERGARGEASRTVLIEERPPPPDPMSVPGDVNRDAKLDISDAVALLGHLFLGSPSELPCGDGTLFDPANLALLSSNGDADVDLSDAVYVLLYLFAGGPPPARGAGCVAFPGCPDTCGG
ncbi:MAG: hypothetical protein HY721_26795, partial [Planctomycetes bacterium]|nr:hypothetical protein [Planctomycetota bacterium]